MLILLLPADCVLYPEMSSIRLENMDCIFSPGGGRSCVEVSKHMARETKDSGHTGFGIEDSAVRPEQMGMPSWWSMGASDE